ASLSLTLIGSRAGFGWIKSRSCLRLSSMALMFSLFQGVEPPTNTSSDQAGQPCEETVTDAKKRLIIPSSGKPWPNGTAWIFGCATPGVEHQVGAAGKRVIFGERVGVASLVVV